MIDIIKKIIAPIEYTVSPYYSGIYRLFSKAQEIEISQFNPETFTYVFNQLTKEFGVPIFVNFYYGFIFKKNKKYIAYNLVSNHFKEALDIWIFSKIPFGTKITYTLYYNVDSILKSICNEYLYSFDDSNHFCWNEFSYSIRNDNTEISIHIKRNKIVYYIRKLTSIRLINYNGKTKTDWKNETILRQGLNYILNKANALE